MIYHKFRLIKPLLKIIPILLLAAEVSITARPSASARPTQSASAGQLDQNCTIALLNRTANVRPDGSWRIDNVPANFGRVRARATCVENGVTQSGQSDFFDIQANAVTGFDSQIPVGVVDPIPVSLTITTPITTLATIGATAQLSVTATYPDGSARDVRAGSAGTSYTVSNSAVATIGADGLVTAVSSGTAIVSAMNEGALGLIQLRVVLGGDTDGDGIPDDVELANGLDPNNPVDALEDLDRDGLTNKQELIDYGTNLRVADTDGDGIPDGEEVAPGADGYITNPLLPDTDGDGIRDRLEIETGSDPTNPASFNLARALGSLEAAPATFALTLNTIVGEASRQITVTGHLIDGTTIDLTSTARGTNYTSSDLTICNFGAQAGRVFAGSDGTCTITAANSGFSARASGVVRTFAPTALSYVSIPGFANNVDVRGNYAYVAAGAAGLQVVDVSTHTAPSIVGSADTPGNADDVRVVADMAYIADGPAGLQILSIADPLHPAIVGAIDTPGEAQDVAVKGNLAFVADGPNGLRIIDITTPATPRLVGFVDTPGTAKGVDVAQDGRIAAVADGASGVEVVDLIDGANPVIIGSVSTGGDARDVALDGSYAFVADYDRSLTSVEISDPRNPIVRASTPTNTGGRLMDVALAGRFAFGADVFFVNGVPIVDVGVPGGLTPRAILDFSTIRDDNGTGIAADNNYVYLTASRGVIENGTSEDTRLYIGQYIAIEDTAGISPTATVTAPAPGSTVIQDSWLPVTVEASDDVAVAAVDLLVNGQVVSVDSTAPYAFVLTAPVSTTNLTVSARAIDLGGNIAAAGDVAVNVIPDPLTTVVGRVVDRNGAAVGGATVGVRGEFSATTAADGSFAIARVPTIRGNIRANARATVGGVPFNRFSAGTPPVQGGTTDVGTIALAPLERPLYPLPRSAAAAPGAIAAVADLNGDGAPDLVTANGGIGVALGNGDGTFEPEQRFAAGEFPSRVIDLNRDGDLDVVAVNPGSNAVSVSLGNGDGTFPFQQPFAVGTGPGAVAIVDLNHDGKLDLAVANAASLDVSVLLGNGDGTFQSQRRFSAGWGTSTMVTGDVNRDGNLDLVAADEEGDAAVLLGNGDGTFQLPLMFAINSNWMKMADLNQDGASDLITANGYGDSVSVLLSNGDGTFAGQSYGTGSYPSSMEVVDLSRDGLLDIVTANPGSGDVSVLVGNGDGTFQPEQRFAAGDGPSGAEDPDSQVVAADLNADGILDLSVAGASSSVVILFGNGDGTFQPQRRFAAGVRPFSVTVADLNVDSAPDLISSGRGFIVLLGNGDGTFPADQRFDMGESPGSVAVANLNGDTSLDIITANGGYIGDVSVILGNGDGTFQAQQRFATGNSPNAVAVANLNGDGRADLVTANIGSDDVSALLGNGDGTFQPEQRFAAGSQPFSAAVADLNGDHISDIVVANSLSNDVSILLGNGDGTFQDQQRFQAGGAPFSVVATDLNHDNRPDVATANYSSNDVSILLGNGDGTFQDQQRFDAGSYPRSVVVADLSGDSAPDLITTNSDYAASDISVLLGNGDGTFQAQRRLIAGSGPSSAAVRDLNADGKPDLAITNEYSSDISVLLGNGDGTFQPQQQFIAGDRPASIAAADLNGDGSPDLVTANSTEDGGYVLVLPHR